MTAAAIVRERPILFSRPMVRAILEGVKTQTRRVVKPQPPVDAGALDVGSFHPTIVVRGEEEPGEETFGASTWDGEWATRCPFGQPGDRLWVRERWAAWSLVGAGDLWRVQYRADNEHRDFNPPEGWTPPRCLSRDYTSDAPSIFFPRWASRLTLEISGVRVERVQEITANDCIAEGIPSRGIDRDGPCIASALMYIDDYQRLWDSLNAARGYGWDANPWVWVVEFRKVTA